MTEEWKIVDVLSGELAPNVNGWQVLMQKPDGSFWAHAIPRVVLEWRVAEYGTDDLDEILDLVLHESYAEPDSEPIKMVSVTQSNAKQKRAVKSSLPTLFEATSTKEALDAHRERIGRVKADKVQVTDPKSLLSHIKADNGMNPASVRDKRELVDTLRWTKLYGGLPIENGKEA